MATTQGSLLRGKFTPLAPNTATIWKGKQVIKPRITYVKQILSPSKKTINGYFTELVKLWENGLSMVDKNTWQLFADRINQYAPYFANNTANIIPQPRGPYTAFNAFIASNMKKITRAGGTPSPVPPSNNMPIPEPPRNVSAVLNPSKQIEVTWLDPDMSQFPQMTITILGIWIKIEGRHNIHPQLVGILPLGTSPPFVISFVRAGGIPTGAFFNIQLFFPAIATIQMDTVAIEGAFGATWSVGSNLTQIQLRFD
jgi:hypothetical protein